MSAAGPTRMTSPPLRAAFYWKDDASGEVLSQWCVEFEKEIVLLFGDAAYTLIEWNERHMIGTRATLALWLHSFLATHERPIPLSVEKYFELCESRCQRLYHFRDQLKQALNRLIKIGFVDHFKINEKDMVEITLCPRQVRLANTRMA